MSNNSSLDNSEYNGMYNCHRILLIVSPCCFHARCILFRIQNSCIQSLLNGTKYFYLFPRLRLSTALNVVYNNNDTNNRLTRLT